MVGGVCTVKDEKHNCDEKDVGILMKVVSANYSLFFEQHCSGTQDIAILELEKNVPKGINHICLPQHHNVDELLDSSTRMFSYGWGVDPRKKGFDIVPVPYLQKVDLGQRMPNFECQKFRHDKPADTFCTYEYADKNVCSGDSGGGVIAKLNGRSYILGVVSHGSACRDLREDSHFFPVPLTFARDYDRFRCAITADLCMHLDAETVIAMALTWSVFSIQNEFLNTGQTLSDPS
ncbi:unnamed protein product [Strongylus vulgaris]|uniref:Peptidase S1 domain-containing protein n=1 Tax=Strongylus vulgaris TaxID=40348 RepID=A0A3P7JEG1_STRVU|nr:unnamed protein product [Strongylus vulgaris]